jgi:flagellar hook-associated protein 2
MAEIMFGGLATGLPTDDIVTKLMALQRRPIDRLTSEKENETTRLKAYSQLNSRLEDLKKAADAMNITSEVRTTKVNLSSETTFKATSANASPGSYNIAVAQLARVQKDVSFGYASKTDITFKTGSLTIKDFAGTAIKATITVDATNNSLQGIQAAINAQSGTTGVSATIIGNDASSYHLVLTGKDASTNFSLDTTALTGGSGADLSITNSQTAQQAVTIIDGIPIVSNSNTVTDAINGVTLNLTAASVQTSAGSQLPTEIGIDPWFWATPPTYATTAMDVVADSSALKEKISTFVSSYNKVMDWINEGYETKVATDSTTTDTSTEEEDILSDYLRGDSTVNGVKRGLQALLTNSVNGTGSLHILSDIGISTNKDGTLNLNSSKLDTAIEGGMDDMVTLLAGEGAVDGVMKKFNSYLVKLTATASGMYADKKDRYKTRVERLDSQIAVKETMMEKIEKTMRARFNAMELLVSNLNAQSSFLTQQMDALTNSGNN